MAARVEILRELGLLPLWRLRAKADRSPAMAGGSEPLTPQAVQEPAPTQRERIDAPPRDSGTTPADRLQRIAALDWTAFAGDVDACTACGLCRTRNKSVPGVGDTRAQWLFVGEAPGADEDAKGEPFVGQAGRLLDSMLAALGMRRGANVYIANVLKCRPPSNRTPEPREVEACRPYLDRQVALIAPRIIVALGKSAATTLLNVDASIASLRGRVHRYQGVPLVVTYHPAYLLRNLPDKAKAWEDLCLARATTRRLEAGSALPLQAAGAGPM
jgi:uracil-DNA glycosylase family 4